MENLDNTALFTDKAEVYRKFRPTYPARYLDYLIKTCHLGSSATVADIGAGTGILTGQLLERHLHVIAVEPNDAMRAAASEHLGRQSALTLQCGTAEHTGIAARSVDAVTVAQAFHWFDPDAFRTECRRILKDGGMVSLVWNNRGHDAIAAECHEICKRYCPSFHGFSGKDGVQREATAAFFTRGCDIQTFENDLTYSREAFIGRYLSTSYAPTPQEEAYEPYTRELDEFFDRHSRCGLLSFPNITTSYTGRV